MSFEGNMVINCLTNLLIIITNSFYHLEKVTIVFEHYTDDLPQDVDLIVEHSLYALYHLHYEVGCIHGGITPDCLVYDQKNHLIKLTHWALNAITECGSLMDVDSLLPFDCKFLPIEQIAGLKPCRKSDIWSLALSILSIKGINVPENPSELAACQSAEMILDKLNIKLNDYSSKFQKFILSSLNPHPKSRSNVKQLMEIYEMKIPQFQFDPLEKMLRFNKLNLTNGIQDKLECPLNIHHVYHLYFLAFPHVYDDDDEKFSRPPILSLPNLFRREKRIENVNEKQKKFAFLPSNKKLKFLKIDKIKDRLNELHPSIFYPLILTPDMNSCDSSSSHHNSSLPLVIKEADFNYQCERMMIFKRLMEGWPFVRSNLIQSSKIDVPPFYRAQVWAAMLNIKWNDLFIYDKIDKISTTMTDRQISVDIPRCHQYNDLLASPQGHIKLTRVLKAWLSYNESNGCVYWQGLDSLASPFVILNFNNEPQAFACFNAFINKYLKGFFVKDNSMVIQEYLAIFNQLMAFHDPQLYNHLQELGLFPDLYAIPWFLTMFTHVLPLHKTMHVWDTLLLGDESFALYIGLAILTQLRNNLLEFTFNDCVLIFSDLPEINVEICVKHAIKLFCSTPKSASQRGVKQLEILKTEIAPRIDVSDLISLVKNEKSKIIILDGRSEEETQKFGSIHSAIKLENFDQALINGHLLVVINSIETATKMVTIECVPRVCLLQLNGYVPNQLLG